MAQEAQIRALSEELEAARTGSITRAQAAAAAAVQVCLFPAWKCVHALDLAHIQAHQPPLCGRAGAAIDPPGNASSVWGYHYIQAHQPSFS